MKKCKSCTVQLVRFQREMGCARSLLLKEKEEIKDPYELIKFNYCPFCGEKIKEEK